MGSSILLGFYKIGWGIYMNHIIINIATDYTKTPGGRHINEGAYSGEDFRKRILKPKFLEALEKNVELFVDLDGGYGYATSFLEEAFGGLARDMKDRRVLQIKIISEEEPSLINKIKSYMEDVLDERK